MAADFLNDPSLPPEISKYLAILSKDPGSMVFAPLAEAYRKAGMLDEAIATAQEGLKLHPNYVSGMVALGRAYYDKGMLAEAGETLERVLAIAPDNIIAANILEEIKKSEVRSQKSEEMPAEPVPQVGWAASTVQEPEVIEVGELEELEEVAEFEEVGAEEEARPTFGEEITEELWTGETISEEVKVEEKEEEARAKKEITTETIAELYIKQGYLDKAIDIYQTLHKAHPFDEEIKKKLDELKRQVEVKVEEEGAKVGWAGPTSEESEVPLTPTLSPEGRGGKVEETSVDENIKRLESWLRTVQSERRKV